jgi:hypothetical protein
MVAGHGAWRTMHGVWCMATDAWHRAHGERCAGRQGLPGRGPWQGYEHGSHPFTGSIYPRTGVFLNSTRHAGVSLHAGLDNTSHCATPRHSTPLHSTPHHKGRLSNGKQTVGTSRIPCMPARRSPGLPPVSPPACVHTCLPGRPLAHPQPVDLPRQLSSIHSFWHQHCRFSRQSDSTHAASLPPRLSRPPTRARCRLRVAIAPRRCPLLALLAGSGTDGSSRQLTHESLCRKPASRG